MDISKDEWDMIYEIEDSLYYNTFNEFSKKYIDFLLTLIRNNTKQLIDPRTHDKLQQIIDSWEN